MRYSTGMQNVTALVRAFLSSRLFRVGVIGILGLTIQTAVFELLGIYLKVVVPSTAVLIGGEASILSIFFLNQRFSFRDRSASGTTLSRLIKFHLVVAGSLAFQWVFIFATEHLSSSNLLIHVAYIAGIGLGFITNYIGYHVFVWKHPGTTTDTTSTI